MPNPPLDFNSYYDTQGANDILQKMIQAKGSAGWGPLVGSMNTGLQTGIKNYQQSQNNQQLMKALSQLINQPSQGQSTQSGQMPPTAGVGGMQQSALPPQAQASPNTKTINGVTYINIGGQWFSQ